MQNSTVDFGLKHVTLDKLSTSLKQGGGGVRRGLGQGGFGGKGVYWKD